MIAAPSSPTHLSFGCMFATFVIGASVRDAPTGSEARAAVANGKLTGSGAYPRVAVEYRPLPSRAAALESTLPRNQEPRNGQRDVRATSVGRPARFVEGHRDVPQTRRDHGPALGKTGGDARASPPARQDGVGLRVPD